MASIETTNGILGWPESSSNPPTQLVSMALNMVPHKQKAELARQLMRREEKT